MEEIRVLRWFAKIFALTYLSFAMVPFLMLLSIFLTFIYLNSASKLSAEVVFTCLALLNTVRNPLMLFPMVLTDTIKVLVSISRINDFLNADELENVKSMTTFDDSKDLVLFDNATFTWTDKEKPTLEGVSAVIHLMVCQVSLSVGKGELVGVVGPVGSGKSSLLSAVLGEMLQLGGGARVTGSRGLLTQQPWIQNMTIRENILFGRRHECDRYNETIESCGLVPDLLSMPAGDQTEIGENGVNLSGGQKQRVALARLLYQQAEVNLLDDPLAALDPQVPATFHPMFCPGQL